MITSRPRRPRNQHNSLSRREVVAITIAGGVGGMAGALATAAVLNISGSESCDNTAKPRAVASSHAPGNSSQAIKSGDTKVSISPSKAPEAIVVPETPLEKNLKRASEVGRAAAINILHDLAEPKSKGGPVVNERGTVMNGLAPYSARRPIVTARYDSTSNTLDVSSSQFAGDNPQLDKNPWNNIDVLLTPSPEDAARLNKKLGSNELLTVGDLLTVVSDPEIEVDHITLADNSVKDSNESTLLLSSVSGEFLPSHGAAQTLTNENSAGIVTHYAERLPKVEQRLHANL